MSALKRFGKKLRIGVVGGGFGAAFHWHRSHQSAIEGGKQMKAPVYRRKE